MTLLHMTTEAEWAASRIDPAPGEDFVHLSGPEQLHVPANAFYAGRRDLVLLAIDPTRLASEIKVEGGFPHLYGPILPEAVFDVLPFPADADGSFHLVVAPMDAGSPPAADLIEAMVQEMDDLYGSRIDVDGMPSATPADFARPKGTFLVGHLDGVPVTGGGVKTLEPGLGEIKRMYVAPEARGQGIARTLLTALEDAARRLGHDRVRLDTGPDQPHAKALYETAGYVEIPNYNDNPKATYFAEKQLT
ncbi:MAG: GCN5-related N-acetyltransferase [Actinomycetia bacterium]|nr:GCN5-related N-acetyltransferase [Actinomycetes bacterium]